MKYRHGDRGRHAGRAADQQRDVGRPGRAGHQPLGHLERAAAPQVLDRGHREHRRRLPDRRDHLERERGTSACAMAVDRGQQLRVERRRRADRNRPGLRRTPQRSRSQPPQPPPPPQRTRQTHNRADTMRSATSAPGQYVPLTNLRASAIVRARALLAVIRWRLPVGYAIDRFGDLSATPLTSPIGVAGVGDRWRLGFRASVTGGGWGRRRR